MGGYASLRYLAFLLPRLEELPVTVLLAVRAGEEGPDGGLLAGLAADPATEVVEPPPLSQDAVGQLLGTGVAQLFDAAFVTRCHQATGGIPFLVEPLARQLADEGIASPAAMAPQIETLGGPTVARWVQLRLAQLGRPAVRLARATTILESGEPGQVAQLAGLTPSDAATARDALTTAGVLARGRPLTFVHPIVRRAVYDEIGDAERAVGHRHAARLLASAEAPGELVAEHLLATEPASDAWVTGQLVRAARAAARTGASDSAAAYLRRALAEPPAPEKLSGVLLELGHAEFNARHPDALCHLEQAVAAAAEGPARAAGTLAYALAASRDRRMADSVRVLDDAIASLGGNDDALVRSIDTAQRQASIRR